MGTFNKKAILSATAQQIPNIAESIRQDFVTDGFEVNVENLTNGGCDISITKGGLFKAVLGMRTALKVTLSPQLNGVLFDAHVGIFGQQIIPALIVYFFFWPVILTQIVGLIQQAQLDDKALAAAQRVIVNSNNKYVQIDSRKFCTNCGNSISESTKFCPNCGKRCE